MAFGGLLMDRFSINLMLRLSIFVIAVALCAACLDSGSNSGIELDDGDQGDVAATLTVAQAIADIQVARNAASRQLDLSDVFEHSDSNIAITLTISTNSNPSLVSAALSGTQLSLVFTADASGSAVLTVTATAGSGENQLTAEDSFSVFVSEGSSESTYGKNTLNAQSPLAINIAPFQAWTPGWVLMDVFPKSQGWVSNLCDSDVFNSGPDLTLDEAGWVAATPNNVCADTSVFAEQAGHYPTGTYVLLWEGEGTLAAQWDVEPPVEHVVGTAIEQKNGLNRMTFDIEAEDQTALGIGIRVRDVTENYIHNIRLIPPGGVCGRSAEQLDYFKYCASARGGAGVCSSDESCFDFEEVYWDRFTDSIVSMNQPKPVFHPLYLSTYQQYRAIRFMKWSRVEDSEIEAWDDRILVHHYPFTDNEDGFPYEYMAALTNLLNADAYLNVPMMVDDHYVREYARLMDDLVADHLKIYLEYGNEIFNSVQPLPYGYALEQANLAGSGIPSSDSDLVKAGKFAGRRSAQIFDIWDEEISNAESRLVKVIVGFNPLPDYTLAALDFENSFEKANALAINGYIGPNRNFVDSTAAFDAMTVDEILQEITLGNVINSGSSLVELNSHYESHVAMANVRNLVLLAYEGGNFMEIDGGGDTVTNRYFQLNRDARLVEAFVQNFRNFEDAGAQLFFYFLNEDLWNDQGVFGARQYQDQIREEAPTFDGLMNYIESTPCWWSGCAKTLP